MWTKSRVLESRQRESLLMAVRWMAVMMKKVKLFAAALGTWLPVISLMATLLTLLFYFHNSL